MINVGQVQKIVTSYIYLERRIGIFRVSLELIHTFPRSLFLDLVIVEAHVCYYDNTVVYTAYSPYFEATAEGSVAPEYTITVHENGDREFNRVVDWGAVENKNLREKVKELEKKLGIIRGAVLLSE